MKKLLFVLLALSVVAWLGCGDTMTDQMGTSSRNGADVDLAVILTAAAQGYYQIPNVLIPLTQDTDVAALYENEGYESDHEQIIAGVADELAEGEYFPIFNGAINGQIGDIFQVWNAETSAFDLKYNYSGQSVLTWFAIDNPNYNQWTSTAKTATKYSTYSFAYTQTAEVTFTELGQKAVLIIGFADSDGGLTGAAALQIAATGPVASTSSCVLLVPDFLCSIAQNYGGVDFSDGVTTSNPDENTAAKTAISMATGYSVAAITGKAEFAGTPGSSYYDDYKSAGLLNVFEVAGNTVVMYAKTATTATIVNVNNDAPITYTVQLALSGGTDTAGGKLTVLIAERGATPTAVGTFEQFSVPYNAAMQAAFWKQEWQGFLGAGTKQAAFMTGFLPGATASKSPAVSMLASSPTQ
jgi:hypothetical protein